MDEDVTDFIIDRTLCTHIASDGLTVYKRTTGLNTQEMRQMWRSALCRSLLAAGIAVKGQMVDTTRGLHDLDSFDLDTSLVYIFFVFLAWNHHKIRASHRFFGVTAVEYRASTQTEPFVCEMITIEAPFVTQCTRSMCCFRRAYSAAGPLPQSLC